MKSISLLSWIYDFIRLLNKGSLDSFVSTMTRPFQDKRDLQTSLNFSRLLLKFRLPSNTLVRNTYNTQRETTSAGFHACSLSWSNLHLESWFLWRKGNWIAWRKPLRGRLEPKTNSAHIKDRARSESGPHWQEASALTTASSLLHKHKYNYTFFFLMYITTHSETKVCNWMVKKKCCISTSSLLSGLWSGGLKHCNPHLVFCNIHPYILFFSWAT